jgi:hypothetical protein
MTRRPRTNASCRSCTRIVPKVNAAGLCKQCEPPPTPLEIASVLAQIDAAERLINANEHAEFRNSREWIGLAYRVLNLYRVHRQIVEKKP